MFLGRFTLILYRIIRFLHTEQIIYSIVKKMQSDTIIIEKQICSKFCDFHNEIFKVYDKKP